MYVGGVVEVIDHGIEADFEGLKTKGDHSWQHRAICVRKDMVKLVEDKLHHFWGEQSLDDELDCTLRDGLQLQHYLLDKWKLVLEVADTLRLLDDLSHSLQLPQVLLLIDADRLRLSL